MHSTEQAARQLGHRPALDGIRAFAILLVIGIHVGLLDAGYIGVDVFLPLSGFLITALLYEERERLGTISLRRFYERRARRLLPALLLLVGGFVLVMLVLHPFQESWQLGKVVASTMLFVNNWIATFHPRHGSVLGALSPTWTLAEELQFYLLWPPVLVAMLRGKLSPRTVLGVIGAAIVALLVISAVMEHIDVNFNPYTSPFDRGAELLLGALAAIAWRERLVPRIVAKPAVAWLAIGSLAYVVVAAKPSTPLWYMTVAMLSTLLILSLLGERPPAAPPVLERVLGSRPLAYTGKVSYGIYLFHVPIYYLVWAYAPNRSALLYLAVVGALSLACAAASWELVEKRIVRARSPSPTRRTAKPSYRSAHRAAAFVA